MEIPGRGVHPLVFLLIATTLEVTGDALVRIAIYRHAGIARFALNLAPLEFGQVVGLYIATLFIVWQTINFITFRAVPGLPIMVGGALVVAGGLIITFWKPDFSN